MQKLPQAAKNSKLRMWDTFDTGTFDRWMSGAYEITYAARSPYPYDDFQPGDPSQL